ncbi:MAG: HAD-IIIC family phosphatase [Bryobacteraceae bacterium]|nr:HAD-IIIC family phosphatase [Bryobacteraceae bacterium]
MGTANSLRYAVSASFTAEPLRGSLEFWGRQLGEPVEIVFAPYNQPLQTLLDPSSVFGQNQHGMNVLLVRLEDLAQFDHQDLSAIEANARHLIEEVRAAPPRFHVPLLFVLCPPSPEARPLHDRMRLWIAQEFTDAPGLQLLSDEEIAALYPVADFHCTEGERLGRIPYSQAYFTALGTAIARRADALLRPPYKVIAVDCDNTLWQGICGEDGPDGVMLDPPRRALHELLIEQRDAGMLLVMASKNNEQDVLDTFAAHPDWPLQPRHFASWRLNWDAKPGNLASLAEELSLGLDSFIFVDDNPKETAEVTEGAPEVLALTLPEDVSRIPTFLHHVWAFDHAIVTDEDRQRNTYYEQSREFGRAQRQAATLNEFMAGLNLQVQVEPLTPERLSRAAQLTQRTNQFNLTTVRRTEAELRNLEVYTVQASDRFGDYGVIGDVIVSANDGALDVDTFLLSCRALGRGVEFRVLHHLADLAAARGLSKLLLRFSPTKKNQPAWQFLQNLGAKEQADFVIDAAAARRAEWQAPQTVAPVAKVKRVSTARRDVDYGRIAAEFATVEQISRAISLSHRAVQVFEGNDIERRLAAIWSELLEKPVRRADNFFDLGGHSLLVVLLILRIKEEFGVALPVDDVYSGTLTLEDLARTIEMHQLGALDPDEYHALLAEIEGLSDEEVRALLAEEQSSGAAD